MVSERIPAFATRKLISALQKRGFFIDRRGGKGSQIKIIDPKTNKSVTIPYQKELKPGLRIRIIKDLTRDFSISKKELLEEF